MHDLIFISNLKYWENDTWAVYKNQNPIELNQREICFWRTKITYN